MINVLCLDNSFLHNAVVRQDAQKYFDFIGKECTFFEETNSETALEVILNNNIDLAFIDISSKKFDGIQLLKKIKEIKGWQPKIIAVTTLCDTKFRFEALKLEVYRYIYQPYDDKEIFVVLEKYFGDHYSSTNKHKEVIEKVTEDKDEFLDFGDEEDDDFFDFDDDEDDIEHNAELMDVYNKSHKNVTPAEFFQEYGEDGIDTEELQDLEDELDRVIANILFDDNLQEEFPNIISLLEKYTRFLYMFTEFEELSSVIYNLTELLKNIDFSTSTKTIIISKFIVAIIQDLIDWKEHVFILKDAVDIYYINASILNSYVQLKDIIK